MGCIMNSSMVSNADFSSLVLLCSRNNAMSAFVHEACVDDDVIDLCRDFVPRTKKPEVLTAILSNLSLKTFESWRSTPGSEQIVRSDGQLNLLVLKRSAQQVETMVRILELFTFFSSRTLENKKLYTGIHIFENLDEINEAFEHDNSSVLLRLEKPLNILELSKEEAFELMQLTDGRSSAAQCDANGRLYGIMQMHGSAMHFQSAPIGVLSDRHGEVGLYSHGKKLFRFDGFEWNYEEAEVDLLASIQKIGLKSLDELSGFAGLIFQLAETRQSSIVCICRQSDYVAIRERGTVFSMRPELDEAELPSDEAHIGVLSMFRLDGAHFVSFTGQMLALAQRVSVGAMDSVSSGSGTNAASFLSSALGPNSIVVKVSSDGMIKCFVNGHRTSGTGDTIRDYFLEMNKPSFFDTEYARVYGSKDGDQRT